MPKIKGNAGKLRNWSKPAFYEKPFAAISRECAIDRVHSKRMVNLVSALFLLLFMGFLGWHEEFFSELYEQPLFLPRHPAVDVFGPSEG